MSALTFDDKPVISARVTLPERGCWFAQVELVAEEVAPGTKAKLASFDGKLELAGTVLRGKMVADRYTALVVGGAGGLEKTVTKQAYHSAPAQIVASGICSEVGETLAPSAALATILPSWTRPAGTARAALDSLATRLGVPWRINAAGLVDFSESLYLPADDETAVELDRDDARGVLTLGVEVPRLLPGTTIRDVKARTVVHVLEAAGVQTLVHFGDRDRVRGAIDRLVQRALPGLDFLARYEARVVAQSAVDDTLELFPIDERIPPISAVPLRVPAPGFRVLVSPGARVLLGWDGGDPSKPFCEAFSTGTTTRLDVACADIRLGVAAAAQLVALSNLVQTALDAIRTHVNAHTHTCAAAGSSSSPPASPMSALGPVAAANVKAS